MVICLERDADLHNYGPADAAATHCLFTSVKSRLVLPFWYRLTWVVPGKWSLNECVCVFVRNSEVRSLNAPVSHRITRGRNAIFGHVARLPVITLAHQAMLRQVELSVGRPPDPTWKRPPGRPRAKWTDQLRRDNNNVPNATLWRQAIGRGHSRATLQSEPTTR